MRRLTPLLLAAVCACAPRTKSAPDAGERVERRVVVERTPEGTRTVIVTTTTRVVEAPPAPDRPGDPVPSDPLVRHNLDALNAYRAKAGQPPLRYDAQMSAFALEGSRDLARDHRPHAHFAEHARGAPGFGARAAENQGDPAGVPALSADPLTNGQRQIDVMLKLMFDEGPGGGHHDNMVEPRHRRVGIGLFYSNGRLYMTNDFSD